MWCIYKWLMTAWRQIPGKHNVVAWCLLTLQFLKDHLNAPLNIGRTGPQWIVGYYQLQIQGKESCILKPHWKSSQWDKLFWSFMSWNVDLRRRNNGYHSQRQIDLEVVIFSHTGHSHHHYKKLGDLLLTTDSGCPSLMLFQLVFMHHSKMAYHNCHHC